MAQQPVRKANIIKPGSMSPGRTRQPFLAKNAAATGAILGVFAIGVYVYSSRAVKKDDNIDEEPTSRNKAPEETKRPLVAFDKGSTTITQAAGAVVNKLKAYTEATSSAEDNTTLNSFDIARSIVEEVVEDADTGPSPSKARGRGLLVDSFMDKRYPWLLDPQGKTLVWGAPPIDDIGSSHR